MSIPHQFRTYQSYIGHVVHQCCTSCFPSSYLTGIRIVGRNNRDCRCRIASSIVINPVWHHVSSRVVCVCHERSRLQGRGSNSRWWWRLSRSCSQPRRGLRVLQLNMSSRRRSGTHLHTQSGDCSTGLFHYTVDKFFIWFFLLYFLISGAVGCCQRKEVVLLLLFHAVQLCRCQDIFILQSF